MKPRLFKSLLTESARRASVSSLELLNQPARVAVYDRLSSILNNNPQNRYDSPEKSSEESSSDDQESDEQDKKNEGEGVRQLEIRTQREMAQMFIDEKRKKIKERIQSAVYAPKPKRSSQLASVDRLRFGGSKSLAVPSDPCKVYLVFELSIQPTIKSKKTRPSNQFVLPKLCTNLIKYGAIFHPLSKPERNSRKSKDQNHVRETPEEN